MKAESARTVPSSKGIRGQARTSGRSVLSHPDRIEPLAAAAITCLVLSTVVWVPGGLVRFVLPKLLLATIGIGLALWARPYGRLPRAVTIVLGSGAVVLVLAALLGAQPLSQLMGRWPRYEGLVALPVYLGAMWAGARLLNIDAPECHWRFLTRILGVAAAALGAVAVLEAAGWEPLGGTSARLGGLSGNGTDQGVCGLLLAMLQVVPALHRGGDWFARIGLAGSMLAVVLSGSRGALLGLAVAGAGLAAMRLLRRRVRSGSRPLQRTGMASWTAAAIVAVSIGVAFAVPAVRSRLLLTDSGASGTVQGRGLLWSESLRLWTEHPWLGTGPSGFVDAITAQHTEEWATQVGSANPPDSPHSWPLQALLSGGPLLLALALVLGTMVVWSGWRAFAAADPTTRSVSNAIVGGGALAAVVGFGVALLTHFTTASTTILVSLLCGALVSSAYRPAALGQRRDTGVSRLPGSALAAAVGAVLLVATAAEWSMERAISAVERGDSQTADTAFQMSERLRPWDADVALLAATALSRQSMTEPSHPERNGLDPASLSASALSWAERAVDRLPESSEAALALATAQEGVGDLTAALRTYQGLKSLSPTNALVWQRQGVVQAETGELPEAETSLLRAAILSPTSAEPWQNLAMLYDLMNRPDDKAAALRRATELGS